MSYSPRVFHQQLRERREKEFQGIPLDPAGYYILPQQMLGRLLAGTAYRLLLAGCICLQLGQGFDVDQLDDDQESKCVSSSWGKWAPCSKMCISHTASASDKSNRSCAGVVVGLRHDSGTSMEPSLLLALLRSDETATLPREFRHTACLPRIELNVSCSGVTNPSRSD